MKRFVKAVFGPLVRASTYKRMLYLTIAIVLGTAYFTFLVTGISTGVSLIIIWVGVPITLGVIIIWRMLAHGERVLAIGLLGASIDKPPQVLPEGTSIWRRIQALLADAFTWRSLVWLFLRFPLGIVAFVVVVVMVWIALAGLAAPIIVQYLPIELGPESNPEYTLTTTVETLPLLGIGVVALVLTPHVVNALAWVHRVGAEALLGPSRAAVAQRARKLEARTTVLEERAKLARELHDSVGHTITGTTLQAGAARHVFDDDPEFARRALAEIEAGGHRALDELDRVLGILRDDAAAERAPVPSLDSIESLIDDTRRSGLPVTLEITGRPDLVPDDAGLALYRIVQEALTNVMRHAGSAPTTVTIDADPERVHVAVENAAPESTPAGNGDGNGRSGRGLVGIGERVDAFGGSVRAGPTDGGGYLVDVVLPPAEYSGL